MAPVTYKVKLTRPQVFLWRMSLFLILAVLLAIILDGQTGQLRQSFLANPGLNALIIGVLLVGVVYAFRQVLRLYPEINWVNNFRISDPGLGMEKSPVLLAPMATMLRDRTGHLSLATGAMRSLLDSVASRLEEQRETTRYLVGLLIFLGLLGTFWGLLQTVSTVGATIGALDTNAGDNVLLFDQLKEGLAGPLKGMGTAFSASMFGLSGSLILGFLDLQAGHAQGRFYNELEDWLSGITELQLADAPGAAGVAPQVRFALLDIALARRPQRQGRDEDAERQYRRRGQGPRRRRRQADPADARRAEGGARMGRRAGPSAARACRGAASDHRQGQASGARGA